MLAEGKSAKQSSDHLPAVGGFCFIEEHVGEEAVNITMPQAQESGILIVLDPVGAGATGYRTETVHHALYNLDEGQLSGRLRLEE